MIQLNNEEPIFKNIEYINSINWITEKRIGIDCNKWGYISN